MPEKKILEVPNYSNKLLAGLQDMRRDKLFSDAILCAGEAQYYCHKAVLASSSPYFRAMFSSSLKESQNNVVQFDEMSSGTLGQILNFAYSGCAEINQDNAQDLLAAGNLLQYSEIVEACCDYLQSHLHPSNCLGIEWLSRLHSLPKLETETQRYIIENFDRVIESDEFLQLPHDRLAWYLERSEIDISSEERLFEFVAKWAELRDISEEILCHIYSLIRYNSMPIKYVLDVIAKNCHFSSCSKCSSFIKQFQVAGDQIQTSASPRPSTLAKDFIVLLGTNPETGLGTMEAFDPMKERWSFLSDDNGLPCVLKGVGMTTVKNDIFVTGGVRNDCIIPEVWCYSSKDHKWISLPNLKEPRAFHSCTSWNNCIYVLGGTSHMALDLTQSEAHETVERLDLNEIFSNSNDFKFTEDNLVNLEWREIAKISCPRIRSIAVCYEGTIIEVGGTQYGIPVRKLETYKCSFSKSFNMEYGNLGAYKSPPAAEKQTQSLVFFGGEQLVLHEVIEKAKIVIVEDDLYILWQDSRKLISLNPQKRIFKDLPKPMKSSVNSSMTAVGNRIYLISSPVVSQLEETSTRSIEYFDIVKVCWVQVKSTCQSLNDIHCLTIRMR